MQPPYPHCTYESPTCGFHETPVPRQSSTISPTSATVNSSAAYFTAAPIHRHPRFPLAGIK